MNILIASINRASLDKTLCTLVNQLEEEDNVFVVFDGIEVNINYWRTKYPLITFILESINLGFWGHGIRNKYQEILNEDYILHMDDDDWFEPEALNVLRQYIKKDYDMIVYGLQYTSGKINRGKILTRTQQVLTKNKKEFRTHWRPFIGGDSLHYMEIKNKTNNIIYIDNVLVNYTHSI